MFINTYKYVIKFIKYIEIIFYFFNIELFVFKGVKVRKKPHYIQRCIVGNAVSRLCGVTYYFFKYLKNIYIFVLLVFYFSYGYFFSRGGLKLQKSI